MKTELPHRSLIAPSRFIRNLDQVFWSLFTKCSSQTLSYSAVLWSKGRNQLQFTFEEGDSTRAFERILLWEGGLARVHRKQVLTYLKLSDLRLGLLINFGGELLKGNIERLVNELVEIRL